MKFINDRISRLIASTTVRSYLHGLFFWLQTAFTIAYLFHTEKCLQDLTLAGCHTQSRSGYMKLSLGLKKPVWSCMLQRVSRGSRNQSKWYSLRSRGPKNEIRCTHARTKWDPKNAFPWSVRRPPWDIGEMHCWGPSLFWDGCNEFNF